MRARRFLAFPLSLVLLAVVPLHSTAWAQQLGQAADEGVSLVRVGLALTLCLLLAVGGAIAIKLRSGHTIPLLRKEGNNRRLILKESLRISHQIDLCIVSCDGQESLIATSANGAQCLRAVGLPASPANSCEDGIPS